MDQSSAPNTGTLFVTFTPWSQRLPKGQTLDSIMNSMRQSFSGMQEATIFPFAPPAIRGLGVRGGFEMQVQDRGDLGRAALFQVVTGIMEDAKTQTGLSGLNTSFRRGVPQIYVDVNREKVKLLGLSLGDVFSTMQAYLGSTYVNDFNKFGRVYQVRAQADHKYRAETQQLQPTH